MNLAFITAFFPFGGGESFFIPELENLRKTVDGHVFVIPREARGERRSDWSCNQSNVHVIAESLVSLGVLRGACKMFFKRPLKSIAAFGQILNLPLNRLVKNLAVYPKAMWLASQVEAQKIGHIHAHWGGTTATMAMLASRVTGVEWSFTCHRWDIYDNNLLAAKSKSAKFARFISKRGMSDAITLGVDQSKAVLIRMGVDQVYGRADPRPANRVPVIMCAANLVEVKGHRYLLQAVALLASAGFPVSLKIAGQGPLRRDLEALALTLNLGEQVEFLGQVEQGRLHALYKENSVDLFVLPSVDLGCGHHEGIPVALMEAMSYGIPVISTRTGSVEELLERALGLTVPDKNPDALAEAIIDLLTNSTRYESVSKKVTEIIRKRWLIKNMVQQMVGHMTYSSAELNNVNVN